METLKNKICSRSAYDLKSEFFFQLIHFLPVFGKGLRNNAIPMTLSSSLPIFPPISPTLFTLVRHPRQQINRLTHAGTPTMSPLLPCQTRQHVNHVTKVSMPPTLPRYSRKHATHSTHASTSPMPPTLARHPRIAHHFSNSMITVKNVYILIHSLMYICL